MRRMLLPAVLLTALALAGTDVRAQRSSPVTDTIRYEVLASGRDAGFQKVWRSADGEHHVMFEFNDRGRGPSLHTRLRLDQGGRPTELETRGVGYFKDPIVERFAVERGRARWSTPADSGDIALRGGPHFYDVSNGGPELGAMLARAALARPGGRIALLPDGEVTVRRLLTRELRAGDRTRRVTLVSIGGQGYLPSYLWLDADDRLFASAPGWISVVRTGWGEVIPTLQQVQDSVRTQLVESMSHQLPRRPSGPVAITNARMFDAERRIVVDDVTVVVRGNRIEAVGPAATITVPAGAEVIPANGRMLLPGLWDMHVHIGGGVTGLLHVAAGVTSARELGNDTTAVLNLRRQFDDGTLIGPRLVLGGIVDAPGPYQVPTGPLSNDPDELRNIVDRYAALGFEQIKLYSSLDSTVVPVIIQRARERGLRVSGHVPAFMTAEQVIGLGYDEIQHINFIFLNFFDDVKDTRTPARFTEVGARAGSLDLESERVQRFIRLMRERDIVLDPTVNVFERMLVVRPSDMQPAFAPIADRFPATMRRGMRGGGLPVPDGMEAQYDRSFDALLRMMRMLHEAGVRMVPGTDAPAGFAYHRELELWERAGIPNADILHAATLGSATVANRQEQLGSIAPGKVADLVLVEGDPLARMRDIRNVRLVMKDGVLYDSASLYQAIGVRP